MDKRETEEAEEETVNNIIRPEPLKLRVWWIPQIPMTSFKVEVRSLREGRLLLNTLAKYDQFQLDHNIKPDYSNAGGLQVFNEDNDNEWTDWWSEDGDEFDDLTDEQIDELDKRLGYVT